MVVLAKTSNKLIRIREFHIDYVGHAQMGNADPVVQWTMNSTLAEIGIHFLKLRKRAIAIGEKIGLYRDWPVSKGCAPPYVPVWVEVVAKRPG
jgi:3-methyladenine DNA glycosylase AlkD